MVKQLTGHLHKVLQQCRIYVKLIRISKTTMIMTMMMVSVLISLRIMPSNGFAVRSSTYCRHYRCYSKHAVRRLTTSLSQQQSKNRLKKSGELAVIRTSASLLRQSFRLSSTSQQIDNDDDDDDDDDFLTTQVDDLVNELLDTDTASTASLDTGTTHIQNPEWIDLTEEQVQNIIRRQSELLSSSSPSSPSSSPVEERTVRGQRVWWKRDDLLKLPGSLVSGNKARKMWTLNQWAVITDPSRTDDDDNYSNNSSIEKNAEDSVPPFPECIVSYGGPQSNAMVALAAIVNYKNRQVTNVNNGDDVDSDDDDDDEYDDDEKPQPYQFIYYTKKLPRFLRSQPSGNLFRARTLGMDLKELSADDYNRIFAHAEDGTNRAGEELEVPKAGKSLFVPQGGAFSAARDGAFRLAQEIYDFWTNSEHSHLPLSVCIPGGTCSTALLVHHGLKALATGDTDIEVVVIPCVGNELYARRQMMSLNSQVGMDPSDIPTILRPVPDSETVDGDSRSKESRYYTFGKPHKDLLQTFKELRDKYDMNVDLLYGAPSWTILWRHWATVGLDKDVISPDLTFDPYSPFAGREIMYVHSGGLEGVSSQMLRYKYDGLVKVSDVQLPGKQSRNRGSTTKS